MGCRVTRGSTPFRHLSRKKRKSQPCFFGAWSTTQRRQPSTASSKRATHSRTRNVSFRCSQQICSHGPQYKNYSMLQTSGCSNQEKRGSSATLSRATDRTDQAGRFTRDTRRANNWQSGLRTRRHFEKDSGFHPTTVNDDPLHTGRAMRGRPHRPISAWQRTSFCEIAFS